MTKHEPVRRPQPSGSLTIVGTGIEALNHITTQARVAIERADEVFYLVTDVITEHYIKDLNPGAVSLHEAYASGKDRMASYEEMIGRIVSAVRSGARVCAVFYGHPGVFVFPSHEALRRARNEGYAARMCAAISAEDCLFADLGVDPATPGCQSFEATDFLLFNRRFDPRSSLVLWQIGVIGHLTFEGGGYDFSPGLRVLVERLLETYPPSQPVIVYEAAHLPTEIARTERTTLAELANANVTPISTLYIPPRERSEIDDGMLKRLGMSKDRIARVDRPLLVDEPAKSRTKVAAA